MSKSEPTTTEFARNVLNYVIQYREKHKFSPSLREIALGLGYKNPESMISSIKYVISILVKQGYMTSVGGISRSYVPTNKSIKELSDG